LDTQENLGLKTFQKLVEGLSQEKQVGAKSSRRVRKHEANKNVFVQNIKIRFRKPLGHPPTMETHLHDEHPHPKQLAKTQKIMTQSQRRPLKP
jgi:hypothetical protein